VQHDGHVRHWDRDGNGVFDEIAQVTDLPIDVLHLCLGSDRRELSWSLGSTLCRSVNCSIAGCGICAHGCSIKFHNGFTGFGSSPTYSTAGTPDSLIVQRSQEFHIVEFVEPLLN
jgi:hypothetical protein